MHKFVRMWGNRVKADVKSKVVSIFHRQTLLPLCLIILLFQNMNMFFIIFALFAYLAKIFSPCPQRPTLLDVEINSKGSISMLFSFYTFPKKRCSLIFVFITFVFFCISVMNQGLIFSWELDQLWELWLFPKSPSPPAPL